MNKLKPCPFCGGEAEFITKSKFTRGVGVVGYTFVIECRSCGVSLPKTYTTEFSLNKNGEFTPNRDEREIAVDLWNRRA